MSSTMTHIANINPIDREALRSRVRTSSPVPNFCIDNFLEGAFADRVLASYPTFEEATKVGRSFAAVNEKGKVQVTDSSSFAEPIAELNRTLASAEFLELISDVFEMPNLLADEALIGGGIHQTGPQGTSTSTSISTIKQTANSTDGSTS